MRESAALATAVFKQDPELQEPEHFALRIFLEQSEAKIVGICWLREQTPPHVGAYAHRRRRPSRDATQ